MVEGVSRDRGSVPERESTARGVIEVKGINLISPKGRKVNSQGVPASARSTSSSCPGSDGS